MKRLLSRNTESIIYICIVTMIYHLLSTWLPLPSLANFGFLLLFCIWFLTLTIGDYLIARYEDFLLRRKIMKLAKQVANYEGIDPKKLDLKNVQITLDKEGYMEVEIQVNKENEDQ